MFVGVYGAHDLDEIIRPIVEVDFEIVVIRRVEAIEIDQGMDGSSHFVSAGLATGRGDEIIEMLATPIFGRETGCAGADEGLAGGTLVRPDGQSFGIGK